MTVQEIIARGNAAAKRINAECEVTGKTPNEVATEQERMDMKSSIAAMCEIWRGLSEWLAASGLTLDDLKRLQEVGE